MAATVECQKSQALIVGSKDIYGPSMNSLLSVHIGEECLDYRKSDADQLKPTQWEIPLTQEKQEI